MDISQDFLKKFATSKSRFFELLDGEEATVKYLYAEEVPNNFDGGKTTCARYHFEVEAIEQLWDRTSRDLANQMSKIPSGALINIKRTGHKSKTKYTIKRVE